MDGEYKIVGFTEATGNDAGTVIWECETPNGQTFRVRPRGTHEYRTELFQNGNDYIGKQLTVRYQELTDDGVPKVQWESQFVTTNKRPNGPRMSSKRIDLTQYEMIRGPWEPCPWEKDEVIDKSPKGRDGTIALVVPWGKNREVSEVHKKAIANLPNIITELKKHYELLDEIVRIWFLFTTP